MARDGADVAEALRGLTPRTARAIGAAALARVLAEHTYDRARGALHALLTERLAAAATRGPHEPALRIVVLGLSLSSSWGNGHATTYRALLRGLAARGPRVLFLERDVPWYAAHRDLPTRSSAAWRSTTRSTRCSACAAEIAAAGCGGGRLLRAGRGAGARLGADHGNGVVAFYDIDTPVTLAALERGDSAYLAARQIPR